ncbi:hypothetical protein BDN67DRAFT_961157 [Paxillus ammoniavirescens]|nr:hypothetical protein BDN67DRAFT_961157 [Paxillus ammoniavirescens]
MWTSAGKQPLTRPEWKIGGSTPATTRPECDHDAGGSMGGTRLWACPKVRKRTARTWNVEWAPPPSVPEGVVRIFLDKILDKCSMSQVP